MTSKPHPAPLHYFLLLDREEKAIAIRRLARSGMSDQTIAAVTGQSVEDVRRTLGTPQKEIA
jgi:hypothetical protein